MCSFLITNVRLTDIAPCNALQRLRGPDHTTVLTLNGTTFVHNLLSINGAFTPQPFLADGVACVYNGEIYNSAQFGNFDSDGECLVPAYSDLGANFVSQLDGEYALVLVDWRSEIMLLATDTFATKPLHYSIEGNRFGVASYASALYAIGFRSPHHVEPNRLLVVRLNPVEVCSIAAVHTFSTDQHKNHFDDWNSALVSAIRKRTKKCREKIFVGLSSGYDSGTICCELDKQEVQYKSYSILNNERQDIIQARVRYRLQGSDFELIRPSSFRRTLARWHLKRYVEPVAYDLLSSATGYVGRWYLHDDPAALGLAIICMKAKRDRGRIYLSGQGADEIMSDYGFGGYRLYPHSNFGGLFPEDLRRIFPWPSFYGSTQAAYLRKEEYVAGSFGIEARYPFLDREVVQEFLSLTARLKNSGYKSALRYYLKKAKYPSVFDEKRGFVPVGQLRPARVK